MEGVDHPLSKRDGFNLKDATVSFIESKTGVKSDNVHFRTSFSNDVAQHAYVRQQIVGIQLALFFQHRAEHLWRTDVLERRPSGECGRQCCLQQGQQGCLLWQLVREDAL